MTVIMKPERVPSAAVFRRRRYVTRMNRSTAGEAADVA